MEWKPVVGFEGLYSVSDTGEIRSERRKRNMTVQVNRYGYYQVILSVNRKQNMRLVHRMVAQAFICNKQNLPQVNHIDENKLNNSVDNLEWCTLEYNQCYGTVVQRRVETHLRKNIAARFYKPVKCTFVLGGAVSEYKSQHCAALETGVSRKQIIACCKGRKETAGGRKWEYI